MPSPKLSIIVVNYQADEWVIRLRKQFRGQEQVEFIEVDNNTTNRGYGGGGNWGARQARGEFLLFCNPDISITPSSAWKMVEILEEREAVGLVGPQIRNERGEVQRTSSMRPGPLMALIEFSFLGQLPFFRQVHQQYRLQGFDHRSSREVPMVNGSCFAMRARDFRKIGGFDESLFLYFEEFDLAGRVEQQLGKKTYFCAEVSATHLGQVSTNQRNDLTPIFRHSRRHWLSKEYGWRGRIVANLLSVFEKVRN